MVKKKAVVIHNVPELAEALASVLRFKDFDVRTATDGQKGLELIYNHLPELVLSDWAMVGLDGYQLLEHIRNDPAIASTIFIFVAAPGNKLEHVREGMDRGADDYLGLPIEPDNLLFTIQVRLKRKTQILGVSAEIVELSGKKMNHHVFLSYAREDIPIMWRIKSDMEQSSLKVWTDESLSPGTPAWTDAIEEAIETAGCVVVVLSPDAKKSEWVNRELEYAEAHDVRVFPVLASGDERQVKPIRLIRVQHTDLRNDYDSQMARLVEAIHSHIGIIG